MEINCKTQYKDYLRLDSILSSQEPLSSHHEEMCFILIHQVKELWIKLILHELKASMEQLTLDDYSTAFKMLARVSTIQRQMVHSWDVLSTLTPTDYTQFRGVLGQASGFQSYQYRLFEFYLGLKDKTFLSLYKEESEEYKRLEEALYGPSIYDQAIKKLCASGFDIHSDVLNREVGEGYHPHSTVENAWKVVYEAPRNHWDLYQLGEKLTDIEDALQQWRFRHMKTVERIIGLKQGTGGSTGVTYLKRVLEKRVFPELWDVRTRL